jgi:hypothetical protein
LRRARDECINEAKTVETVQGGAAGVAFPGILSMLA